MPEDSRTINIRSDSVPEGTRPIEPLIDRVVDGRYQIIKPLSTGGMGSVFLGKQLNVDREVAIKLITSSAPNLETRFQREAQALAAVTHPAIVEIHDFITAQVEGQYFLVMAYIDGIDLEEFLSLQPKGRLKPAEVLSLIIPVASAMVELHAGGIIHRDIKPSNIVRFLRADKRAGVKLVDFGIARREIDPNLTAEGIIMGTPPYLSPEVMLGKKHSQASDVYALGATIFELLTGTAPFGKDELHEIMKRTVHDALVLPEELKGNPVGVLLKRLLAKNPDKRPSAMETLTALEQLPGRVDSPATITLDAITTPARSGQAETLADLDADPAGVPQAPTAVRASDRIMRKLNGQPERFRLGPAALFAGLGLVLGALVMFLLRPGCGDEPRARKTGSGAGAAVKSPDAGPRTPPPEVDAAVVKPPPEVDAAVVKPPQVDAAVVTPPQVDAAAVKPPEPRPAPMDAAVPSTMAPPDEPKALPTTRSLVRRCRKSRRQPRILLRQAQRLMARKPRDPDSVEHARRILHVLLQGGCVKPFTKMQRQAAYVLAKLYIFKGACYSAKNVWRMYARRYKKAFPHRKRPPFPPCKLKRK